MSPVLDLSYRKLIMTAVSAFTQDSLTVMKGLFRAAKTNLELKSP